MHSVHIILRGKVQAVFFRTNARKRAHKLGITGFVRNMPDGTLEIRAEGESEQISEFIEWCKKGPFLARVQGVSVTECPPSHFSGFSIQ